MKQKQNNNTHTTKPQKQHKQQHPQKALRPAGKTAREICKLGETGETIVSLSLSNVLFRHVVLRHVCPLLDVSMSISAPGYSGKSRTSGRRRRLSWYVPSLVCHLFAQFSMNASTSDCATASLSDSAFNNFLMS